MRDESERLFDIREGPPWPRASRRSPSCTQAYSAEVFLNPESLDGLSPRILEQGRRCLGSGVMGFRAREEGVVGWSGGWSEVSPYVTF